MVNRARVTHTRVAHRVTVGLVDARSDLAHGCAANARARLESLQADLDRLDGTQGKPELTVLSGNLLDTARTTPEGAPENTDAHGFPIAADWWL